MEKQVTTPFATETHEVDFCVVGGGLAGMTAAIAAARRGASVALMQDRPVLGGNASSEIRMWICGCDGPNLHETGIIEELQLDNDFHNSSQNCSLWDAVLFGAVRNEPRIRLFLNCSCNGAEMDGDRIVSVTGWQTTTQKWVKVKARLFADCSGDSVLAPLSGAETRIGREAREEFGESLAHEKGDRRTMGMSCLIQARETAAPQTFVPFPWARSFPTDADLKPSIGAAFNPNSNYWWLELGGNGDSIADTEKVRDDLIRTALGVWDHYKNRGEHGAGNWALDWIGFLPGKRESRRYLGDMILTQGDLETRREFPDAVAYGGWPLDDHDPNGFEGSTPSNIAICLETPYQIPYRCLYSRNVANLFCAGRNVSVSHAALSSTRVMCTCAIIGQAAGTAAAIAARHGTTPRGVYEKHLEELRQALLEDDCYIPGARREVPDAALAATLEAESDAAEGIEALRNGADRAIGADDNGALIPAGTGVTYRIEEPVEVDSIRIVLDSDLMRHGSHKNNILSNYPLNAKARAMPATLVRDFRVEVQGEDGSWAELCRVTDNHRRLHKMKCGRRVSAIRLVPERSWGGDGRCHVFSFDFSPAL